MSATNEPEAQESRFEILEAVVGECVRDGQSPALERWMALAREGLTAVRESGSARDKRSAESILGAFELAAELVETLTAEARS